MKKKNIWFVNQYAGSPIHGMVYRTYFLAKEFVENGYNVNVIAASYGHIRKVNPVIDTGSKFKIENIDNINYIWLKTNIYKMSKSLGRLLSLFVFAKNFLFVKKNQFIKPDIIIVSSPSPIVVIPAYILAKKYKAKLFFEVRDLWPLSLKQLGNYSKFNPFIFVLQRIENFAYKKAHKVISVLPYSLDYMVKHKLNPNKFNYIPNGVEENKKTAKLTIKLPKSKFIIGYTGTVGIANKIKILLEAAKALKNEKDILFVIVGDGGEKDKLQEYVIKNELKNVLFYDPISKDEIPKLLENVNVAYIGWRNIDLYKYGTSANKVFDYMLAAVPIINVINVKKNIVNEANCGVTICSDNYQDLAQAIKKLYNMSKAELTKIGKNGQKYVKEHHLYSNLAKKYSEVIEDCFK